MTFLPTDFKSSSKLPAFPKRLKPVAKPTTIEAKPAAIKIEATTPPVSGRIKKDS